VRGYRLVLVFLFCVAADASLASDTTKRTAHIGFLRAEAPDTSLESFRRGMRELGYIEGRNLVIEQRWANGKYDDLPRLAQELVDLKVDVILTASTPAALAAQGATRTIPIVIARGADPVASGLVTSLARPGGNVTGLTSMVDELSTKRLELLKEVVPGIVHVAVLWSAGNPTHATNAPLRRRMDAIAPNLKLKLAAVEVINPSELDHALGKIAGRKPDALYVFEDPVFSSNSAKIIGFAAKHRLPAIYGGVEFVRDGGLISYAPSFDAMFKRAAGYVDRILSGANPADLPIERPTKFELVVNLKTAKALGITIPQSILLRADEVIR